MFYLFGFVLKLNTRHSVLYSYCVYDMLPDVLYKTNGGENVSEQKIRIILKAYDHRLIDEAVRIIINAVARTGAKISGPVPLPTKKEIITILRGVHKHKDSREQFERRTHKRLIDILSVGAKTMEILTGLSLPDGVEINLKIM